MSSYVGPRLRPVIARPDACGKAAQMQTLLKLKAIGLTVVEARCLECASEFSVSIEALHLPDDTPLDDIWALRPIACLQCSAPTLIVPPSFSEPKE